MTLASVHPLRMLVFEINGSLAGEIHTRKKNTLLLTLTAHQFPGLERAKCEEC